MTTASAPPQGSRFGTSWPAMRRRMLWTVAASVGVYLALAVYGDYKALARTLTAFPWRVFPLVLLLTLGNYTGRLIKWQWYLRLVGAEVSTADATRIFGVAMTMVLTPGKAGELLKSYMVKNVGGTPMRVTAPIVLSERLTDGLAMMLLASVGLYSFKDVNLMRIAAVVLAMMVGVVVVVQLRPLALGLLRLGRRLPVVGATAGTMRDFYESSYLLLRPRNLIIAITIGTISWSCEGLAYYLVLRGLGVLPGLESALSAIFIFSISSILGAIVATPGGLAGTEAGLVTLSIKLLGMTKTAATAGAFVVRFATLWFGVGLGLLCFAAWSHLLEAPETPVTGDQPSERSDLD